MKSIQNIIFDLGGVLLNINIARFSEKLLELSQNEIFPKLKQMEASGFFDQYESGQFSDDEFIKGCIDQLELTASAEQIKQAWNAILLDFPKERIEILNKIRSKKRIFLLSNTNQIHIDHVNKKIEEVHSIPGLDHLFEDVFLSHKMKLKKPNPEIYKVVLNKHSLNPEETLFIDDSISNVESAKKVGIHSAHLEQGLEIGELLNRMNLF